MMDVSTLNRQVTLTEMKVMNENRNLRAVP